MSKQKQEIIPKIPKAERVNLEYPKQVNRYYTIPTTSMMKFDGTEPLELIKKINPTINGKNIFARVLVRYTG